MSGETKEHGLGAARAETALEDAERQSFDKICEVLGLRAGVNAAIGLQPGLSDCAVWDIGYLYTGDQVGFPADTWHFRGKLELYNRSRAAIQRWLMRLMLAFPIAPTQGRSNILAEEGNVVVLRIAPENGAVGEIGTIQVKQNERDAGRETFYCVASFDIVFTARERAAKE